MAANDAAWLEFAIVCESLAGTRSKLVKRAAMAEYLRRLDTADAGVAAQYLTGAVFPETDERKLQVGGQMIVRALETVTRVDGDRFHAVYRKHGDLGSTAEELLRTANPASKHLSVAEVRARLDSLAMARTQAAKSAQLVDALRSLSPLEAKYFIKLITGDMRTGVKQSLVEEAIAVATQRDVEAVRRAEMFLGNLDAVVELARRDELATARFQMFHPLGFMLATPVANAKEAYARFAASEAREGGEIEPSAQMEDKYDGMRAQVHCGDAEQPGRVRIFSRTREDVTASFPELAEWFSEVKTPAILDGEILAWDFDAGRALPFTALQPRLSRKRVTSAMRAETPVVYMAFDVLLEGGELLLQSSLRIRRARLEEWASIALQSVDERTVGMVHASPQGSLFALDTVTDSDGGLARLKLAPIGYAISPEWIDEAFTAAQARGNEGLMLKSLESTYQPGRRGAAWVKLKRELATLDVVVTAVEYGHGRRAAVLSDYTFAVRDRSRLRNVGKAYSGLTDEEILTMTQWFKEHTLESNRSQLMVEPKIVLEVAFNNVMQSERHDSGYSLRFPRILRLRPDKPVEEIDTLERVAEIFHSQGG
ncbi:MAG TPA: ATP-dependent DNA ligase [Acidobacteriaceae bacterium]|nr:ATP-dependent DNA ligase [Acidobacteriaceae bacterium]